MEVRVEYPHAGRDITFCGGGGSVNNRVTPQSRECVSLGTGITLAGLVASLLPAVLAGQRPDIVLAEPIPGIPIALEVEPLGLFFALIASVLWIVTTLYSIGYMRGHGETNQTRFYAFFAVAIGSTIGIAFSQNLFTLFIFYELLTLSTYPLVTHSGTLDAKRGGRVYLGILLSTSSFSSCWQLSGPGHSRTTIFVLAASGPVKHPHLSPDVIRPVCFRHRKSGADAISPLAAGSHGGTYTCQALLHAVAVVKQVFSVFSKSPYMCSDWTCHHKLGSGWLLWIAAAPIIIASLVALQQNNLSVVWLTRPSASYPTLSWVHSSPTPEHHRGHPYRDARVRQITLFFCAGAILVATHKSESARWMAWADVCHSPWAHF
ncbi:MAG: hypothetical protein Ct9H300mP14_00360 [Gammaproteobacteria bacterium]|nr:MAG: hypothetical protein Ct9H300mP14_00360 [Gammaproteobacteria bacterium]